MIGQKHKARTGGHHTHLSGDWLQGETPRRGGWKASPTGAEGTRAKAWKAAVRRRAGMARKWKGGGEGWTQMSPRILAERTHYNKIYEYKCIYANLQK